MVSKLKLYVGCSLTHAPEEFKEEVAKLKTRGLKNYEFKRYQNLVEDVFEIVRVKVKELEELTVNLN